MDFASSALQELSSRLERGEIDSPTYLEALCRQLSAHVGCTRAGVWIFVDGPRGRALRCAAMYDRHRDAMVDATDMVAADVQTYFDHLLRDGIVIAPDARTHPATANFLEEYLEPLDVHSILDTCLTVNGTLFGTFCCEQVGARSDWSPRQVRVLKCIAAKASLALARACQPTDTAPAPLWDAGGLHELVTRPQEAAAS